MPTLRRGAAAAPANRRRTGVSQHDSLASGASLWVPNVDEVTLICHFIPWTDCSVPSENDFSHLTESTAPC